MASRFRTLVGAAALAAAFVAPASAQDEDRDGRNVVRQAVTQPVAPDAVPFPIGFVDLETDPRFNEEYAYYEILVRPIDRPILGAEVGEIDAITIGNVLKTHFRIDHIRSDDVQELSSQLKRRIASEGMHFAIVDLPAPTLLQLADAVSEEDIVLLNISAADNNLREADCRANVVHIIPSQLMYTDALVQYLVKKKWTNILVLQGPLPEDQALVDSIQRSANRFGANIVDVRQFLLSNDPRNREQNNVALLTNSGNYDVVWVADTDGEYARNVPYQTNDPRPVVGASGLVPVAWHWAWDRQGAPQVNDRFEDYAQHHMGDWDWAAFVAVKGIVQSVLRSKSTEFGAVRDYLLSDRMNLDGTKGNPMSVRSWDHQLRQPLLLAATNTVVDRAPVEGFLHETNELDSIGVDQPESTCRF